MKILLAYCHMLYTRGDRKLVDIVSALKSVSRANHVLEHLHEKILVLDEQIHVAYSNPCREDDGVLILNVPKPRMLKDVTGNGHSVPDVGCLRLTGCTSR